MSDSVKHSFVLKISQEINFRFSTIFLVKFNDGHGTIKVHVNKVQYCRAGHKSIENNGILRKIVMK